MNAINSNWNHQFTPDDNDRVQRQIEKQILSGATPTGEQHEVRLVARKIHQPEARGSVGFQHYFAAERWGWQIVAVWDGGEAILETIV